MNVSQTEADRNLSKEVAKNRKQHGKQVLGSDDSCVSPSLGSRFSFLFLLVSGHLVFGISCFHSISWSEKLSIVVIMVSFDHSWSWFVWLILAFYVVRLLNEETEEETNMEEDMSSLSDVLTVQDVSRKTKPSRNSLSGTSLRLPPSEILQRLLFTNHTLFQNCMRSFITVSRVLSIRRSWGTDQRKPERFEPLLLDSLRAKEIDPREQLNLPSNQVGYCIGLGYS